MAKIMQVPHLGMVKLHYKLHIVLGYILYALKSVNDIRLSECFFKKKILTQLQIHREMLPVCSGGPGVRA